MKYIGAFLRQWCDRQGIATGVQAAQSTGISPATISRLWSDKLGLTEDKMLKFLAVARTPAQKEKLISAYLSYFVTKTLPGYTHRVSLHPSDADPTYGLDPGLRDNLLAIIRRCHAGDKFIQQFVDNIGFIAHQDEIVNRTEIPYKVAEAPPHWGPSSKDGLPDPHHHDDPDRKKPDRNQ